MTADDTPVLGDPRDVAAIAGIAHEINNPLAAVMANLGFAIETRTAEPSGSLASTAQVDEALEALTESRDAAERVRQIVSSGLPREKSSTSSCPTS